MTTGGDDFTKTARHVKKLLAVCAAALAPILAGFAGLQPPWPPGISKATALLLALALIVAWPVASVRVAQRRQRVIVVSAAICLASLFAYFALLSVFTYRIPTPAQVTIVLGCGYTDDARTVAASAHLDTSFGCPGNYLRLLQSAQYEAAEIWTHSSILVVQLALVASWLAALAALSIALFTFAAGQQPASTRKKGSIRPAS